MILIEELTDFEVAKDAGAPLKREKTGPLNNPFSSVIRAFNLLERKENVELAFEIFMRAIKFHKSVLG